MRIEQFLRKHGILSRSELLAAGYELEWIKIAAMYGGILRVRKGWYAHPNEASAVIRAWRVGGRLSCVSALAYTHELPVPARLHIEVPGNAARLRSPSNHRRRLEAVDDVVVHWNRNPRGGDRRSVEAEVARAVAAGCSERAA